MAIARPFITRTLLIPGQLPPVRRRILAEPELHRRHVLAGRRRHPPAAPFSSLVIVLAVLHFVARTGRHPRGWPLDHREHRVQPPAPDEPRWPVVDQLYLHRLRSHRTHQPASPRSGDASARVRVTGAATASPRVVVATSLPQGKTGSFACFRNYIRSSLKARAISGKTVR